MARTIFNWLNFIAQTQFHKQGWDILCSWFRASCINVNNCPTRCDYTGCNRRNGPDFGRVFLRSNYTDI